MNRPYELSDIYENRSKGRFETCPYGLSKRG
jgi:hypothetical protein